MLDILALVSVPDRVQRFDFATSAGEYDIAELWREGLQKQLADLRSRHLGYVLQTGGLLGYLDVRSNIGLSRRLLGLADDGTVGQLAEQLEIGDQLRKKPAAFQSGNASGSVVRGRSRIRRSCCWLTSPPQRSTRSMPAGLCNYCSPRQRNRTPAA